MNHQAVPQPIEPTVWRALLKAAPLILVAAVTTVLIHNAGWLGCFENSAIDSLVRLRPVSAEHVFVVGITDSDYTRIFDDRSPLDSEKVCRLVKAIAAGEPRVIVVDLDTSNQSYRNVSLPDKPAIVWAASIDDKQNSPSLELNASSTENAKPFLTAETVLGGLPNSETLSGVATFPRDPDGVIRWYTRYVRLASKSADQTQKYQLKPTLAWSAVQAYKDTSQDSAPSDEKLLLASTSRSDYVPRISAGDLLEISQGPGWKALVKGKIVLLGGYFENARDTFFCTDGKIQGVELQAQAIESELQRGGIPKANPWLLLVAQLLASLAFVVVNHFLPGFRGLLFGFSLIPVAAILLSVLLFSSSYLWFDFVPVMLTVQLLFLYGHVQRIRRQNQELLMVNSELLNTRNELARAIDQGAELERKRLAQELHDDTLGKLFQVSVYLQPHAESTADGGKLAKGLSTVHAAMAGIRAIMMNLYPPVLDKFGLSAAIKELALSQSDSATEVEASIAPEAPIDDLPKETQLCIYRIVQEALNNARKHSGATKILVSLSSDEGKTTLSVIDNGKGMLTTVDAGTGVDTAKTNSYGIHGIKNKASLMGAEVKWNSPPPGYDSGTEVLVEILAKATS